jgi:hypothetical protein
MILQESIMTGCGAGHVTKSELGVKRITGEGTD